MKTGAGEDPFADDEGSGSDEGEETDASRGDAERATDPEGERPSGSRGRSRDDASTTGRADRAPGGSPGDEHGAGDRESGGERVRPSDLPYIARRNASGDNVKAGRETRRLFELRPEVAEREGPFLEELERRLGREVHKTDAREAALAVVYDRPELVAAKLEEWGINYFDR